MAKATKIGMTMIVLLAIIPLYLFFNDARSKENQNNSANINEMAKVQATETVGSKDNADKEVTTTVAVKEEVITETGNNEAVSKGETVTTETIAVGEKSEVQKEFLVVIDPGHQQRANLEKEPVGPGATETKIKVSGGTSGVATGKPEYKLTLEASLILGDLLEKKGVKVIYTRTSNEVNLSNKERADIANQNNADLLIRIHADGSNDRNVNGLSVLTPAENVPYTESIYEDSLKASQFILDETKKNTAVKVNGLSYRSDLSGFNWSKVPSTLIEMGFMSNPTEDKNLSDPTYLTNLLTNIADGITLYASYKK
jgi:N-acetylmuramoyl-L-alanine amidase